MYKVYKHTSPSGKVYIGITGKKNCEYRWDNGRGYVQNEYFSSAIKKYGWENIKHEILFDGLTKEEACKKEFQLIKEYKSDNREYGYNLMHGGVYATAKHSQESIEKMRVAKLGKKASIETKRKMGESRKGRPCAEETKRKISLAQKGVPRKKHTEEWKQEMRDHFTDNTWNMKAINQYSKSGEFIASFVSAKQAQRETGCDNRNILAVCLGKRKSAYGYIWKYAIGGE